MRAIPSIGFAEARDLQDELAAEIASGERPATLLLLQHSHCFTFGTRARPENLLWSEARATAEGVELYATDRGGDATYHGPGQLVGYPLLPLNELRRDGRLVRAVDYIRGLERTLVRALADVGLPSGQRQGLTGVWVQPDVASRCPRCPLAARAAPSKIASIGVRINSRGISLHGFALNVNPDMRYWEGIVACDLPGAAMISLEQVLDPVPSMKRVVEAVTRSFASVFDYRIL